jgi:hypothetical protein
MGKGTFNHKKGEKESDKSRGLCYTYVKVALTRAKIIDGVLAAQKASTAQTDAEHYAMQLSASKAGPALIAKGFKDVTAEVPDARWAAAGDVIVYAWSDTPGKRARKKTRKARTTGISTFGTMIFISAISFLYRQTSGAPRWFRQHPKDAGGQYPAVLPEYINIRIYRKVFATQRIRAFLRCIREFECQAEKDDSKRYQMLNAPLPSGDRRFSSYKTPVGRARQAAQGFDGSRGISDSLGHVARDF